MGVAIGTLKYTDRPRCRLISLRGCQAVVPEANRGIAKGFRHNGLAKFESAKLTDFERCLKQSDNISVGIHINAISCGYTWQSGHGHNVATNHHDKASTGR